MDDVKGNKNESDILEAFGHALYDKIKCIVCGVESKKNKQNDNIEDSMASLKGYNDRLIACNGDCGSSIAKFIDNCIHNKVCYLFISIMFIV